MTGLTIDIELCEPEWKWKWKAKHLDEDCSALTEKQSCVCGFRFNICRERLIIYDYLSCINNAFN